MKIYRETPYLVKIGKNYLEHYKKDLRRFYRCRRHLIDTQAPCPGVKCYGAVRIAEEVQTLSKPSTVLFCTYIAYLVMFYYFSVINFKNILNYIAL
jgi:hypothetical protein